MHFQTRLRAASASALPRRAAPFPVILLAVSKTELPRSALLARIKVSSRKVSRVRICDQMHLSLPLPQCGRETYHGESGGAVGRFFRRRAMGAFPVEHVVAVQRHGVDRLGDLHLE